MSEKYLPGALLVPIALLFSACRIPLTEHPLTDESSSAVDERLIGDWELDFRHINPKLGKKPDEENKATYRVQRVEDKPGVLMAHLLKDGQPGDESALLLTTHLAMHDYFTWGPLDKDSNKPFAICMYEVVDADRGKFYVMDDAYVVDLIERGQVAGKIDRGDGGGEIEGIMLTGESKELRKLLERHAARCFDLKNPILCRRMKPSVEQEQSGQR